MLDLTYTVLVRLDRHSQTIQKIEVKAQNCNRARFRAEVYALTVLKCQHPYAFMAVEMPPA